LALASALRSSCLALANVVCWAESREALLSELEARRLVTLLVSKGVQANGHVQNALIQQWAAEAGLDDGHLLAAGDLGWIDKGPIAGTITLTEEGFTAGIED
jgi:hypothetical protein